MSSHTLVNNPKAMECNACEATGIHTDEFSIPASYNINTLKLMCVNPHQLFCYWELTPAFLDTAGILKDRLTLLLKTADEMVMQQIQVETLVGSYYFNEVPAKRSFFCEIFYYDDSEKASSLLTSNRIKTPADRINLEDEECHVWMKKVEGWSEIIHSSMPSLSNTQSSKSLIKETALLRKWELHTFSSFENTKDKK
ncbi:MAG: DUF4912 domain-containing protein [Sulfuricurvum sp.]